jgi:hypothetical protein
MNNENYLTKLGVELGLARPCGVQFDELFGSLDGHWGEHFGTVDYPRGRDGVFTDDTDYVGERNLSNDCHNRNGKGVKYDLFFYLEESGLFVDVKDKNPHCPKVWAKKKLKSGKEVSNGLEVTLLGSPSSTKSEDVYNTILEKDYALLFVWKDENGTVCLQSMNALDYCEASSRGRKSIVKKGRGGLELKIREKEAYVSAASPVVKLTGVELIDRVQVLGLIDHLTPPTE